MKTIIQSISKHSIDVALLGIALCLLLLMTCSSCQKDENIERNARLECGDSIVWIFENDLQFTQIIVQVMPNNTTQFDPITGFWWYEKGTYKTTSFDGGGNYYECYIFHKYQAWVLIDPVLQGSMGQFVFYEEGIIRNINILDGISWN